MLARNELFKTNFKLRKDFKRHPHEAKLPLKYLRWNLKWKAPYDGLFFYQDNNTSRYFEYPWAFYAIKIKKGMKVLDFGGGHSGFQFVLDKCGLEVHNVDPGLKAKGIGWPVNLRTMHRLNKKFRTKVILHNCFIQDANLPSEYFDAIYSISVFEHLTGRELHQSMQQIYKVLKPRGYCVITLDLFPNIYPFTKNKTNRWGKNVSVKKIIDESNLKLIFGDKKELYGFEEFKPNYILENLEKYFIGSNYPVLTQTLILQKK